MFKAIGKSIQALFTLPYLAITAMLLAVSTFIVSQNGMAKVWRLMGHYDAETATYSACAGSAQTSPYTPDFSGRLIGLRTQVSATAATSLVEHVQARLTCTRFNPNSMECFAQGNGLQTVPCTPQQSHDFVVDQPVQAGVPIAVEMRCTDGTPVTCNTYLYGCFDVGG